MFFKKIYGKIITWWGVTWKTCNFISRQWSSFAQFISIISIQLILIFRSYLSVPRSGTFRRQTLILEWTLSWRTLCWVEGSELSTSTWTPSTQRVPESSRSNRYGVVVAVIVIRVGSTVPTNDLFRQSLTRTGTDTIGSLYIMLNLSHYSGSGTGTRNGNQWLTKPFFTFPGIP